MSLYEMNTLKRCQKLESSTFHDIHILDLKWMTQVPPETFISISIHWRMHCSASSVHCIYFVLVSACWAFRGPAWNHDLMLVSNNGVGNTINGVNQNGKKKERKVLQMNCHHKKCTVMHLMVFFFLKCN